MAVLDEARQVRRVTNVFGVRNGEIAFGDRPQLTLGGDETDAVLIEIDHDALAGEHADYVRARANEITVELAPPPPTPRLTGLSTPSKATRLPAVGLRISGKVAAEDVLRSVTLVLPVDPEYCRPTDGRFAPFGARAEVVGAGTPNAEELLGAVLIGNRLVLWTPDRLHVLEQGGLVDESASLILEQVVPPGVRVVIRDLALDPVARQDGTHRLLLTVELLRDGGSNDGALLEAALSGGGRLSFVRTATVVPQVHRDLEGVDVSDEGRAAFVSEEGAVYLENPDGGFSALPLTDLVDTPKARSIVWTGDPDRPLLATSRDRIHVFDTAMDRFDSFEVTLTSQRSLHLYGVDRTPGTTEVWGAGTTGYVMRYDGRRPEPIQPTLPPRYVECSRAQGNLDVFVHEIEDLAVWGDHVYLILEACSAVMAIRRSDGCSSLFPVLSDRVEVVDDDVDGLLGIHASSGQIFAVGRRGRVYRLVP